MDTKSQADGDGQFEFSDNEITTSHGVTIRKNNRPGRPQKMNEEHFSLVL